MIIPIPITVLPPSLHYISKLAYHDNWYAYIWRLGIMRVYRLTSSSRVRLCAAYNTLGKGGYYYRIQY